MSKGIMAAMAAAFSAGILPIFTKLMQNAGATPGQVLVYRYLFVFLLTGAYFVFKRRSPAVGIKGIAALIFFSICGYGGSCFLLACAFNYLPIGLASMLYFTYPVFVMLIMTFIFRERPTAIKVLALLLAVAGILFLMEFKFEALNAGSILAIAAGFAYSLYLVGLEKSVLKTMDSITIIFYLSAVCTIFFGAESIMTGEGLVVSVAAAGYGLILAVITVFVLASVAYATRCIGPTKTSLIIAFEAVVSLIMGILVFGDPFNSFTLIGAILMTASVIIISMKKETLSQIEEVKEKV